jgi:cell pole-organizing protein PopZ
MGDISAEPSMEEILSSIKRIIAEEGDTPPGRQRRTARPPVVTQPIDLDDMDEDEILELSDPMPMVDRTPSPRATRPDTSRQAPPVAAAPAPEPEPEPEGEPIVSRHTAAAARAPLEALSRLMVKPDPSGDGTLEGLVRDMLRPMLREWIDANVPAMVEEMVAKEIAKITAQG